MNLLKAASTVSLFTLASRITGLARELLIASAFGASAATDAFNVAFRIPNLLRRLFAEGAFSQAFVPLLAATRAKEGDEVTQSLIDAVATVLVWALLVTCVVGVVAAPVVVWLMASGLARFDDAVVMTRWMFPYIGCMSLVALAAGILNTWKHFVVPAATPVVLNLCMIGAAVLLAPRFAAWGIEPIYAMAAGVMLGGLLQLAVQLPALARLGHLPHIGLTPARLRAAWHHPGVHRVLKQMAPALLGVSVAQLSLLINTQIASQLGPGAVSWLTYADRLMEFPTALLGVALGVVLLPQLSAAQAREDAAAYSALLDWGLRLVLLLALPCAAALLVFAHPLVATLYHYGAFAANDVQQTVVALMGYGIGLMGLVGTKVLAPGFYARLDIRTPVRIAVVVLAATQAMNLVFVPWIGHAGLALSIGLGALLNAGWLLVGLRRRGSYTPAAGWLAFFLRVLFATLLLAAALSWVAQALDWTGLRAQPGLRVALLAAVLGGAAVLYFGALVLCGIRPRQFVRRV
ncbi:murein biosynthesis integral membrane protein MurJ [Azohydromonas caseinilytica]|uniref:Probable lipid II flippase MurJ n=1 Tax=Azohydromonas caseinilytica TaxID=2728836 RepID=A0A848F797_9BURK|nr:murein biosynthesis integral membrane protein MurJ [Azohydromonas caseinilytica]NML14130.1 murein biosynthesis integral membrane protein MurJ [Azohydromonas caseinilytica]